MWDDISLGFALYFSDESESEGAQSFPTFCDPMDCSPSGFSSINGILQARMLEWVAIFFSRGSSWPRDQTQVSHTAGRLFTIRATKESQRSVQMPWTYFLICAWGLWMKFAKIVTQLFRQWHHCLWWESRVGHRRQARIPGVGSEGTPPTASPVQAWVCPHSF